MYLPAFHREDRLDLQHDLIRAHPFATLIVMGRDGLVANSLPFLLDTSVSQNGVLRAHVARANPVWQEFNPDVEALVVFQGPEIYVSPNFYATKKETGKVVPTWNYASVHAYGKMKAIEDKAWLLDFVRALTDRHEVDQPKPWSVDDAPDDYIAMMLRGIVGIEIEVSRLEGKWKMSQNRVLADREGVAEGLRKAHDENADAVADLVEKTSHELVHKASKPS
ncbi:MAG TPA: FMN-binding negative transcriptional regulator [Methylovirgula sp.]|nr:FMN-binding negative transcriptional regulator [Methylovirgula sp.]